MQISFGAKFVTFQYATVAQGKKKTNGICSVKTANAKMFLLLTFTAAILQLNYTLDISVTRFIEINDGQRYFRR